MILFNNDDRDFFGENTHIGCSDHQKSATKILGVNGCLVPLCDECIHDLKEEIVEAYENRNYGYDIYDFRV